MSGALVPLPLPRVAIVGAGFAGRRAEAELLRSKTCEVVLLDAKPFFEYQPAALRSVVQPGSARGTLVGHPKRVLRRRCVGLELTRERARTPLEAAADLDASDAGAAETVVSLLLENGERLECDWLLLTVGGGSWALPTPATADGSATIDKRVEHYKRASATLHAASSAVVVGGGEVGVEAAAELACLSDAPSSLTLVSATPTLLPSLPPAAGAAAAAWLRAKGVSLLLGERVSSWGNAQRGAGFAPSPSGLWELKTDKATILKADCVWDATGPVTSAARPLLANVAAQAAGRDGNAAVTPSLRIRGLRNAFAAGDAASGCGNALAAEVSASFAAKQLLALIAAAKAEPAQPASSGGPSLSLRRRRGTRPAVAPSPLRSFTPPPRIAAVSLGPLSGVLVVDSLVLAGRFWGFVTAAVKAVIQTLQIALARELPGAATLWRVAEAVALYVLPVVLPFAHALVEAVQEMFQWAGQRVPRTSAALSAVALAAVWTVRASSGV